MTDAIDPGAARAFGGASGAPHKPVVPASHANFERAIVSVLGLPFDAIGLAQAVEQIRSAALAGRRCFVSTSNLNFAVAARSDPSFRDTVLGSDLNLIDGMPLVWIARLLGLPIVERVAGSDVFEALQAHAGPPIRVYLFGGPPGAAAQACAGINRRGGGVRCVGFDEAGFGSIDSMSGDDLIARINRSGAHFVLASLGAKKGQAWLERNAAHLTAPVLCHLGAVLNFAAGTLRRAPRRVRWLGLEWLWRIKEQPELWRRYWTDGAEAIGLLVTRVIPDFLASRWATSQTATPTALDVRHGDEGVTLYLHGSWSDGQCAPLRKALATCADDGVAHLIVDLSDVATVGDTFVALCLLARGRFAPRGGCHIVGATAGVSATFRRKLAEQLLSIPPRPSTSS